MYFIMQNSRSLKEAFDFSKRPHRLLRAQERPTTLILTVTSGLRFTRARHVNEERTESGS